MASLNSEHVHAQFLSPIPHFATPTDCSLPGSSIHGIFQPRVLEWGVIAFSDQKVYKQ